MKILTWWRAELYKVHNSCLNTVTNLRTDWAKSTTPLPYKKMMNIVDITLNIATNSIKNLKIFNQSTDQDNRQS